MIDQHAAFLNIPGQIPRSSPVGPRWTTRPRGHDGLTLPSRETGACNRDVQTVRQPRPYAAALTRGPALGVVELDALRRGAWT